MPLHVRPRPTQPTRARLFHYWRSMRASRLVIIGAASHVCCAHALHCSSSSSRSSSGSSNVGPSAGAAAECQRRRSVRPSRQQQESGARWSWFVTGGGTTPAAAEDEPQTRWWRSRKRRARQQAEERAAAEGRSRGVTSGTVGQIARRHVVAVQGMLRRLRRWLVVLVDITTLKRLRLLRHARQVRRLSFCATWGFWWLVCIRSITHPLHRMFKAQSPGYTEHDSNSGTDVDGIVLTPPRSGVRLFLLWST